MFRFWDVVKFPYGNASYRVVGFHKETSVLIKILNPTSPFNVGKTYRVVSHRLRLVEKEKRKVRMKELQWV